MTDLTPKQLDHILYNMRELRRLCALYEPKTSTSVVALPTGTKPMSTSSSIDRAATLRAEVSVVLDRARDALCTLPRHQYKIVRLRYGLGKDEHPRTMRDVAEYLTRARRRRAGTTDVKTVSTATVHREIDLSRKHLQTEIGGVSREFWRACETLKGGVAKHV